MLAFRRWSPPLLAALVLGLSATGASPTIHAQAPPSSKTDDLVERINRARVQAGLLPLARSPELDAAAQQHSADMVAHNYLDHTGSDGSEPQERADRAGYHVPPQSGWIVVEVISAISADAAGPVDWWLNQSPEEHGKVLLNPRWREIGAGYAQGGEYGNYWTALFGCRPGVLPAVTFEGTTSTPKETCGDPSVAAAAAVAASTPTAPPAPTSAPLAPTSAPTAPPTVAPVPTVALVPQVAAVPTSAPDTGASSTALTASPTTASPGSLVLLQWQAISAPSSTDWLGLYRPGDADTTPLTWIYVGCAQRPLDARALGACGLLLPATLSSGTYEFRLFAQDSYQRLAVSLPVYVL